MIANLKNTNKGFTLIELLIVMAIIGLMSTIVTSVVIELRHRAKITKMASDLRAISKAFSFYYNDNGHMPPQGNQMPEPADDTCEQVALSPYIIWPKPPFEGNYNWIDNSVYAYYTLEIRGASISDAQLLDNMIDNGNLWDGAVMYRELESGDPQILLYTDFGTFVGSSPLCP